MNEHHLIEILRFTSVGQLYGEVLDWIQVSHIIVITTDTMPVLRLTQLAFVIFNIILVVLSVLASGDFCGSVFETQVGKYEICRNRETCRSLFLII